jgi:hypothetical protein
MTDPRAALLRRVLDALPWTGSASDQRTRRVLDLTAKACEQGADDAQALAAGVGQIHRD